MLLRDFGIYVYTLRDWTIPATTHNFFFNTSSSWRLLAPRVKIHYFPTYRHKNEHHVKLMMAVARLFHYIFLILVRL